MTPVWRIPVWDVVAALTATSGLAATIALSVRVERVSILLRQHSQRADS